MHASEIEGLCLAFKIVLLHQKNCPSFGRAIKQPQEDKQDQQPPPAAPLSTMISQYIITQNKQCPTPHLLSLMSFV
jgi:hypothetical protein